MTAHIRREITGKHVTGEALMMSGNYANEQDIH